MSPPPPLDELRVEVWWEMIDIASTAAHRIVPNQALCQRVRNVIVRRRASRRGSMSSSIVSTPSGNVSCLPSRVPSSGAPGGDGAQGERSGGKVRPGYAVGPADARGGMVLSKRPCAVRAGERADVDAGFKLER